MAQRSSIFTRLPLKLRIQLDQRLIAGGFSGYAELTEWLNRQGYRISKSALNRYGVELEHRERELALARAGEQAALFAGLAQEEDGVPTTSRLLRIVQTQIMMMLANHEGGFKVDDLTRVARAVIDLARVLQHSTSPDQPPPPSTPPPDGAEPDSDRNAHPAAPDPTIELIRDIVLANSPHSASKREEG